MNTIFLKEEISRCEDLDDLRGRIFPTLHSQQEQWAIKINEILDGCNYSRTRLAELTGVSRMAVSKWCGGSIPKNRETFIKIGMAAGFDVAKMNQFLQRYGRYPALYSKSLGDCACIFVLEHYYGEEAVEKYEYILKQMSEKMEHREPVAAGNYATIFFDAQLRDLKDENELERFISENSDAFATAYHNFYVYVQNRLMSYYDGVGGSVHELAEGQSWSASLRQSVSAIRQNKWYPTRNKIISLGLHLSMDHDQIDEMLQLAHMEPLCAKNIFESVIMFILDDASLNNMMDETSDTYDPDALCRYARDVFRTLDLPELEDFMSELPEIDNEWEMPA